MKRGQDGFSLIEMAIVLGVAGVILGGVWVAVSNGSAKAKTTEAMSQIIVLHKNIRGFYQNQACIAATGDLTPVLLAANPSVLPREMIAGGGAVTPWATAFQVRRAGAAGCGTTQAFQYILEYQNMPPDACITLVAMATAPGEASRGLVAAAINGVPLTALPPGIAAISGNAVGTCGENATALVDLTYNLRLPE